MLLVFLSIHYLTVVILITIGVLKVSLLVKINLVSLNQISFPLFTDRSIELLLVMRCRFNFVRMRLVARIRCDLSLIYIDLMCLIVVLDILQ